MSTGSALVIPIPDLEPVVGPCRWRHDPVARLGVPAHVTVHFPWCPADTVDAATLAEVGAIAASVPPIEVTFAELRWFGDQVAWLAPEPDRPFRDLASRSAARWPDYPLYSGEFADVIPHLTLGELSRGGDADALRAETAALGEALPLRARADAVVWLTLGADGHWSQAARVALGTGKVST